MDDLDRKATLTGVAISLGGNIVISLALNLQKLAHSRVAATSPAASSPAADSRPSLSADDRAAAAPDDERTGLLSSPNPWSSEASLDRKEDQKSDGPKSFLRSPLWWLGILALSAGELCNFAAYSFAPASVVAPLGTAALVANWVFAPLILRERFRSQDTLGVALAILGAGTIVLSSRSSQSPLDPPALVEALRRTEFIIYSAVVAALIIVLALVSETCPRLTSARLEVDITLTALLGGFTVLSTKAVSSLLNGLFWAALRERVFWAAVGVLVVTALGQLRYLNKALASHPSKRVVPSQFCGFTIAVLTGSGVLYRDFDDISPKRFVTFLLGLAVTLIGVVLLTPGEEQGGRQEEEGDAAQGQGQVDLGESPVSSPTQATTPLLPTLRLPAAASPAVAILPPSSPSSAAKPRLRSLSTASVRGLSAGGLLLSSSLGRNGVPVVLVVPAHGGSAGGSTGEQSVPEVREEDEESAAGGG